MNSKLMKVDRLSFSYGATTILSDISFEIEEGTYNTIIGPNGSGKTTLLNLVTRQLKESSGSIQYRGRKLQDMKIKDTAKEIAVIYQNTICNFPYTCFEAVLMGLHPHIARFEKVGEEQLKQVEEVLRLTGAIHLAEKELTNISGGELQRVLLARSLVQNPKLLIIDEAMSDLDISAKFQMNQLLNELKKKNKMSILAIHHDLNIAFNYSDQIMALQNGKLAACGSPDELLNHSFFSKVFDVDIQIYPNNRFVIYKE